MFETTQGAVDISCNYCDSDRDPATGYTQGAHVAEGILERRRRGRTGLHHSILH